MATTEPANLARRRKRLRREGKIGFGVCAGYGIGLAAAGEPRGAVGWGIAGISIYVSSRLLRTLLDVLQLLSDQATADGHIIEALTHELMEQ